MTAPRDGAYDRACHLSRDDITVDDPTNPQVIWVTVKTVEDQPVQERDGSLYGQDTLGHRFSKDTNELFGTKG